MSFETPFNQKIRDDFKKAIDYPTLVARHTPEKIVSLDWHKKLASLTDKDGNEWIVILDEETLGQHGERELRITLKSQKGTAMGTIITLSGDWKHRLDYLVWHESFTNRTEVNLKIIPGIDDIYLIPKDSEVISSTTFLYGNLYVTVTQWDAGDIDALARAMYQLIEDGSRE